MLGRASIITVSNTPIPPGTWLMIPAMTAAAYAPMKVTKSTLVSAGSNHQTTAPARLRSIMASAICGNPTEGPGARSAQPRISRVLRESEAHNP